MPGVGSRRSPSPTSKLEAAKAAAGISRASSSVCRSRSIVMPAIASSGRKGSPSKARTWSRSISSRQLSATASSIARRPLAGSSMTTMASPRGRPFRITDSTHSIQRSCSSNGGSSGSRRKVIPAAGSIASSCSMSANGSPSAAAATTASTPWAMAGGGSVGRGCGRTPDPAGAVARVEARSVAVDTGVGGAVSDTAGEPPGGSTRASVIAAGSSRASIPSTASSGTKVVPSTVSACVRSKGIRQASMALSATASLPSSGASRTATASPAGRPSTVTASVQGSQPPRAADAAASAAAGASGASGRRAGLWRG